MAVPKDSIPSLLECQCQICVEILFEPVTLPCNHTLCKPCFESTVEKASLCCPFCRRRVSSWARYRSRTNSLVNMELWEIIQKHYPKECSTIWGKDSLVSLSSCYYEEWTMVINILIPWLLCFYPILNFFLLNPLPWNLLSVVLLKHIVTE